MLNKNKYHESINIFVKCSISALLLICLKYFFMPNVDLFAPIYGHRIGDNFLLSTIRVEDPRGVFTTDGHHVPYDEGCSTDPWAYITKIGDDKYKYSNFYQSYHSCPSGLEFSFSDEQLMIMDMNRKKRGEIIMNLFQNYRSFPHEEIPRIITDEDLPDNDDGWGTVINNVNDEYGVGSSCRPEGLVGITFSNNNFFVIEITDNYKFPVTCPAGTVLWMND